MENDPLKDLDDDLEHGVLDALDEGLAYWTNELHLFDAGESVVDPVTRAPMTRDEILAAIKACRR